MGDKKIKAIIFDWGRTLYDNDNEVLFPETKETLDYLASKYNLAIVSLAVDGNFERRWKIIRENDLEKYFTSILFTQADKDQLYTLTLEKLKLEPRDIAVVDDRVIRGIKWGNAVRATTVWVKKGKFSSELPNSETGEPTYIIEKLEELRRIF